MLEFDEIFWPTDFDVIGLPSEDGRWLEWFNLAPATGRPLSMGFTAAGAARDLAAVGDDELVADAMASPASGLPLMQLVVHGVGHCVGQERQRLQLVERGLLHRVARRRTR